MFLFFFFFSSRRRHTISTRDWSSDVCSSDLLTTILADISGWMLQRIGILPGLSNLNRWVCPLEAVPRLCPSFLLPEILGQKTLCETVSLFLNSAVVPC